MLCSIILFFTAAQTIDLQGQNCNINLDWKEDGERIKNKILNSNKEKKTEFFTLLTQTLDLELVVKERRIIK